MKYIIQAIIIASLSGCLKQPQIKTGFEGKRIPSFTFLLSDNKTNVYTDSIQEGKQFAIFYYNPDCPYCKSLIRDILKHQNKISNTDFYLLTNYSYNKTYHFIKELKLNNYKNIITVFDSKNEFLNYFYISYVPYLAFFDRKKCLKQVLIGQSAFADIREIITNK